jgi:hypothetical protein
LYSLERCVSLVAEEEIGEDEHHFYELPLPEDFLRPARRDRAITVALAHTPMVRTTRFDSRGSKMSFRLVAASGLEEVSQVFRQTKKDEREDNIPEFRTPSLGSRVRDKGTVQAATYDVKKLDPGKGEPKLFVVVTRTVPGWAQGQVPKEAYALTVILEDRSQIEVRYYQQIQERLRGRVRQ